MNIQIFGKSKCFDTKKAERYFKERGIKYQRIDLVKYGISKGELSSVCTACGGARALVDPASHDYVHSCVAYVATEENITEKLIQYPGILRTPIVRNGKLATIGFAPEVWATWK